MRLAVFHQQKSGLDHQNLVINVHNGTSDTTRAKIAYARRQGTLVRKAGRFPIDRSQLASRPTFRTGAGPDQVTQAPLQYRGGVSTSPETSRTPPPSFSESLQTVSETLAAACTTFRLRGRRTSFWTACFLSVGPECSAHFESSPA